MYVSKIVQIVQEREGKIGTWRKAGQPEFSFSSNFTLSVRIVLLVLYVSPTVLTCSENLFNFINKDGDSQQHFKVKRSFAERI